MSATGIDIPVLGIIAETLPNRHRLIPSCLERIDHELSEVVRRLLVNIVAQLNVRVRLGIRRHSIGEDVLARLDLSRRVIEIILGVNVEVDDMVPELGHIVQTPGVARAGRIGRAEVLGEPAEDVAEGHLVVDELLRADLVGRRGEVLVRPRVRGELVARGVHPAQDGRVARGLVVDLALAEVVARDEEGGLDVVGVEHVEDVVGQRVGAVVKGQGECAGDFAGGDVDIW